MKKEELQKLIEIHQTIKEISKVASLSKTTIRYWLKKHDLKTERISEKYLKKNFIPIIGGSKNYREVCDKLNISSAGVTYKVINKYIEKYNLNTSHFMIISNNKIRQSDEEIFKKHSKANNSVVRKRIKEKNLIIYECAKCNNNGVWMNQNLTLHLDHINGDRTDNRLENLRWLCPNCHQQTSTWGSKNIKNYTAKKYGRYDKKTNKYSLIKNTICKVCRTEVNPKDNKVFCSKQCYNIYSAKNIPSKENLIKTLLKHDGIFLQVAKVYSVSDNTVRKWCKKYNIPHKSKKIKKFLKDL